MINIIRVPQSAEQMAAVFAKYPIQPLLPPLGDPAWQATLGNILTQGWAKTIRDRATALLDQPLADLSAELYADFFATGRRLPFENLYFERRRHLACSVMAALLESDPKMRQKFVDSALAKARGVFAESSWSLPAHVWNMPTGQDSMVIDLFAAETANLFSELLALLGPVMPDDFKRAIHERLNTQFFQNYLDRDFHWMKATHNWNAVCHQGVLGAALGASQDPKQLGTLFHRAAASLKQFLSGFAADGGSSEGAGYWGYGFGWFSELNDQLESRTQGELSLFEGDDHVRAIAEFGPRMTLTGGYCVNFSDNSPKSAPRPALLQYLGDRLSDPFIRSHAALAWHNAKELNLDDQRADVFHLTRRFLRCPAQLSGTTTLPETDIDLPVLSVIVTRFHDDAGRLWEFAAKGGNNAEHHNHNDVGSYLLNIDGHRVLTEIGAPEYNKAFFSSKRYESIAARSLGHPVPLINGIEQQAGAEFVGKVLKKELAPSGVHFALDLTGAYPAEVGCTRCVREISVDKAKGDLRVTDTFDLKTGEAFESAIVTESPVLLRDGIATVDASGLLLRITPAEQTVIAEVQTHPFSAHRGQPTQMYRIVLKPKTVGPRGSIGYLATVV